MPDSRRKLSESEWQKTYPFIAKIFPQIRKIVDDHQWVKFNMLRDQGFSFDEIAMKTKIPVVRLLRLENPRKCILKHDHDAQKVRDCILGKIDP